MADFFFESEFGEKLRFPVAVAALGELVLAFAAAAAVTGANELAGAHGEGLAFVHHPFVMSALAQGVALGFGFSLFFRRAF